MGQPEDPPGGEWPEHFPPDCPDPESADTDGEVFRLAKGPADWLSAAERGAYRNKPECSRASLSCFLTLDDVREHRRIMTKFSDHGIVCARLEPVHGKIEQSGPNPGHHSLWLRAMHLAAHDNLFSVVPE